MIKLEKVSKDNYEALLLLEVSEDQKKNVSSNAKSLASAFVYRDCIYPFAIYNDEELIGFIMTRFNKDADNHFIWQFMIDKKHQRKGYGKIAINELLTWIIDHFDCPNIITTVIKGNLYVEQMYERIGFKKMGEADNGETDFILNVEKYRSQMKQ